MELEEYPEVKIPLDLPLSTLQAAVQCRSPFLDILVFTLRTELSGSPRPVGLSRSSSKVVLRETEGSTGNTKPGGIKNALKQPLDEHVPDVFNVTPVPSTIEVFSRIGGLGLLAKHLPIVYPDTLRQIAVGTRMPGLGQGMDKDSPVAMQNDPDWAKLDGADEFYDDMMESIVANSTPTHKKSAALRHFNQTTGIPPHSMAAFGLFLSLPRFSEVLLGERVGAQCMLRLVMGVTDDADGSKLNFHVNMNA